MSATYVNVPFNIAETENIVIPLNRWSRNPVTIQLTSGGAGTAAIEGTTQRVNRGETPTWQALVDSAGGALTTIADPSLVEVQRTPLEAIRITAAGSTITGTLMQGGS